MFEDGPVQLRTSIMNTNGLIPIIWSCIHYRKPRTSLAPPKNLYNGLMGKVCQIPCKIAGI